MKYLLLTLVLFLTFNLNLALAEEYTATGTVQYIDLTEKEMGIKHKKISSIGMAQMPMIFKLTKISLNDNITVGKHVNFTFTIDRRGKYIISELNPLHEK